MGYDVRVKGIIMLGQSVVDVWGLEDLSYSKAQLKTDITEVVNYFRTTLGYTDVPFYFTDTTQMAAYATNGAVWNDAITELNVTLGRMYLQYCHEWVDIHNDSTHPDGASGVMAWGEGATTNGHKNLAQLIYDTENGI